MKLRPLAAAVRPRAWSLRTRLAAVSTLVATLGLGIAGTTAYVVTSRTLHQQIDESLRGAPVRIGSPGGEAGPTPSDLCQRLRTSSGPGPALFSIQLIRRDGSVCATSDDTSARLVASDFTAGRHAKAGVEHFRDGEFKDHSPARIAVVSLGGGDALLLARDVSSIVGVLSVLKVTLIAVVALGALLALVLSRWISRAGLLPVTRFAQVAEDIARTGNLDQHVVPRTVAPGRRHDELDRLALAFNRMTVGLADAQMRQRRLVADAGHELRTPLSSLRANVALLRRSRKSGRELRAGEEERLLFDIESQAVELSELIGELSELASPDSSDPVLQPVRFDETVERAVDRARRRSVGHEFVVALEPWVLDGDAASLERAVVNLLDNAVKFSPQDSRIEVRLSEGTLTVADQGPGLLPGDEERVFERFWRAPRARALPGGGLGLSIVREVATRHLGSVSLTSRAFGGAVATLVLPGRTPTRQA